MVFLPRPPGSTEPRRLRVCGWEGEWGGHETRTSESLRLKSFVQSVSASPVSRSKAIVRHLSVPRTQKANVMCARTHTEGG